MTNDTVATCRCLVRPHPVTCDFQQVLAKDHKRHLTSVNTEDCHCQRTSSCGKYRKTCSSFSNTDLRKIQPDFLVTSPHQWGRMAKPRANLQCRPLPVDLSFGKMETPRRKHWHVHTIAHPQTTKSTNRKPKTPTNFAPSDGLRKKSGSYFSCYLSCCLSIPKYTVYCGSPACGSG